VREGTTIISNTAECPHVPPKPPKQWLVNWYTQFTGVKMSQKLNKLIWAFILIN